MKDLQIDNQKFVPAKHVTIAANFLVHELANIDPIVESQYNLYFQRSQNYDMFKKQFLAQHGLTT